VGADGGEALPSFQDISKDQIEITDDESWKTFFLYGYGFKSKLGTEMCPRTAALMERIPSTRSATRRLGRGATGRASEPNRSRPREHRIDSATGKGGRMSSYSMKNLKEIDDVAGASVPEVEARFARKHLDSRELGVSYFHYAPGYRSRMGHHHREQEEAYVIVGGSGRMKLDEEIVELRQWDVIRVAPEVVRAFESGPEGLEIIAVGGSRPEDGDGAPVPDWWTD